MPTGAVRRLSKVPLEEEGTRWKIPAANRVGQMRRRGPTAADTRAASTPLGSADRPGAAIRRGANTGAILRCRVLTNLVRLVSLPAREGIMTRRRTPSVRET